MRMKRAVWAVWAVGACALMLAAGCGPRRQLADKKVPDTIDHKIDRWGYLEAIGIGASDPALPSLTQRRALSRDAAIIKAQYELLSVVKGVKIEGGATIARAIEKDSDLRSRIDATIAGAEVVKSEFTDDNGCVVTLRLPKKRLEGMMGVRFQ